VAMWEAYVEGSHLRLALGKTFQTLSRK
jgi:hypothetical protein